ncbi:Kinesin-like protein [Halotydeus destructor]|nr:Kinesin-like protein [Halotydeus destructor]
MLPQAMPISQPIKSQRFACVTTSRTAHVHAKYDLLVWFEICELAPNGDYIPVVVDHYDENPCRGAFLLHQGIQRRIRISVIHEPDVFVNWKEIKELVVGRVRNQPECHDGYDDEEDESILSLSLFPGEHLIDGDNRTIFRFEAAWDTSLHNSVLLNRVTPAGERIYLTMSAYVDLEQCTQPAVVTKDICLYICGRDSRIFSRLTPNAKSLKQILSGAYRNADCNHQSAVYELLFKRISDCGSPGVQRRQRRVLDTSNTYVRGEENLSGWQPRNDSLIFDHQWDLEKMHRIELVERIKHVLMVRDKMESEQPPEDIFCGMTSSSSRMNLAALTSPQSPSGGQTDHSVYQPWDMTERERELCYKYISLIQSPFPTKPGPMASKKHSLHTPIIEDVEGPSSATSSPELLSPEKPFTQQWNLRSSVASSNGLENHTTNPNGLSLNDLGVKPSLVPELEEIRVSPMTSRKGLLYMLDPSTGKWRQRWLIVKRPYLFLFNDEKDLIERGLINLANGQLEYDSEDVSKLTFFSIVTKDKTHHFQTPAEKDVHEWLYAINPLLAGEMRSKSARVNKGQEIVHNNETPNTELQQCSI